MENTLKQQYEEVLTAELTKLQACQEQKSVTSCSQCSEILGCEIRANYVKAVYDSMSLGQTGGFEF